MDAPTPAIPPRDALERVAAGALHIDVREDDEFAVARIPGAVLLPLSEFLDRYDVELPRDREIVVSCRSGARSGRVVEFLRHQGYQAVNLAGGILDWEADGLPVERPGATG
jgi:rhodanese-related sulfurtransferase